MTRRKLVRISTVTVMPEVSGIFALSIFIAVSSSDTVTGKTETFGLTGGGGRLLSHVGGRGGVGEGALGVLLGDGCGSDVNNLAVQGSEASDPRGRRRS